MAARLSGRHVYWTANRCNIRTQIACLSLLCSRFSQVFTIRDCFSKNERESGVLASADVVVLSFTETKQPFHATPVGLARTKTNAFSAVKGQSQSWKATGKTDRRFSTGNTRERRPRGMKPSLPYLPQATEIFSRIAPSSACFYRLHSPAPAPIVHNRRRLSIFPLVFF